CARLGSEGFDYW
nr:immunoglobulin heavy chain junction region [Mus musculus]NSM05034.1 immunoglobulin heavy chain junction region [Mus musculus]